MDQMLLAPNDGSFTQTRFSTLRSNPDSLTGQPSTLFSGITSEMLF